MRTTMTLALMTGLLVIGSACKKKASKAPSSDGPNSPSGSASTNAPFLQGTKDVPARLEWNRDLFSNKGGVIGFGVSSTAPFTVTVVTDKGRNALLSKSEFNKSDTLFYKEANPPKYEGRVTIPPGRAWFIIENRSDEVAHMKLECFEIR